MAWWKSREKTSVAATGKRSRLLLQALEPRLMFDGAAMHSALAAEHADVPHPAPERTMEAAAGERPQERHAAAGTAPPARQVVFIMSDIANYQSLTGQLPQGADVVVLDGGKDGLAQMAQWAAQHHGYAAMHIVSHGEAANLMLGSTALTADNLQGRQAELAALGAALRPGGDILLYGCNIGAGSGGAAFVGRLAELSHADVAASTDATGTARLGGNWSLERQAGNVEAHALQLDYQGLLARPVNGVSSFNSFPGGILTSGSADGPGLTALNVDGWDFTLRGASAMNCYIAADTLTYQTTLISGNSSDGAALDYMMVKPGDGSVFRLDSVELAVAGLTTGTVGTLQLIGFYNGAPVSGAIYSLTVTDAYIGGQLVTFNLSANSAFQAIDSFRVQTDGSYQVTGSFGIDNIGASNFRMPNVAPYLAPGGGSAAYRAGNGNAVAVDDGIMVGDNDNATLASARVAITGNFRSGEDLLAFNNSNASMYGNISASYNSSTGILSLTSSGATATLAQWQAALRAVTYQDTSLAPYTATRTVSFTVNDGSADSTSTSTSVTLSADAAPVIGNLHGDNPTFTEKGGAVLLDSGMAATVVDSDTVNFNGGNLTVHISAYGRSGDILGIDTGGTVALSSGTSAGSVVSVGGVAIGVIAVNGDGINGRDLCITFNGNATSARTAILLQALSYNSSSNDPGASRTVNVSVNDGKGASGSADVSVSIRAVNDAPTASATALAPVFTAGGAAVPVFSGAGVSAVEAGQGVLALTLSVSGLRDGASEILLVDGSSIALVNGNVVTTAGNGATVTVAVSGATATVTISSSGMSVAAAAALINGVSYRDTASVPTFGARVVTLTSVTDNGGTAYGGSDTTVLSLSATVSVQGVPVVSTSGGSASFTAGDNTAATPVTVDGGLTVSDPDSATLASATVAITGNFQAGEDVLGFTAGGAFGNISGSYNSGTGVLTLTSAGASATLAQWQAALRSVTYTDSAVTPNGATRTIMFQLNDGAGSGAAASRAVTVTAVDQTPIASASGGAAAFIAANNGPSAPVAVDSGMLLSDLDNTTFASATVWIAQNFRSGQDSLAFVNTSASTFGNIVATYNSGTGVLTLASSGATATVAQWQAALRAVTYSNSAITPDTAVRAVSFVVNDGTKNSAPAQRAVSVAATAQTPVVTVGGGSTAFMAGDNAASMPVRVDGGLTLSDLDSTTLASARVAITGNFRAGEDILAFANDDAVAYGNIRASYDAASGVLTLTSDGASATVAQWQAALRAVTYVDSAVTPQTATRGISFQVNDGAGDSNSVTRSVTVAAVDQTPLLQAGSGSGSFQFGGAPVAVDGAIVVSDLDSATLASATVSLTGNFHAGGDVLGFTAGGAFGNISGSYNGSTGVLTLTSAGASATLAQWQAALRSITYAERATTPDTATRTIAFAVNDGSKTSAVATYSIALQLPPPAVDGLDAGSDTGASGTDGVTSNARPVVRGTAVAHALITILVDGVAVDTTVADAGGAWSYAFAAALGDGTHGIAATASSGGVSSLPSAVLTLLIDSVAPAAPLDLAVSHGGSVNRPVFTGNAEAGSTVTVFIDGVASGTASVDAGGRWTYQPGAALADGQHSVSMVATDLAGNAGAPSATLGFKVGPPAAPGNVALAPGADTGASATDGITRENRPPLTGLAEAGSGITVYVDGVAVGTTTADAAGVWQLTPVSSLADGAHTVQVVAANADGASAPSAALTLTIDTAAPSAPGVPAIAGGRPGLPLLSGSAEAGSTVIVHVDGVAVGSATADAGGAWTYQLTASLADGAHAAQVLAIDIAGNRGALSGSLAFDVDTRPPGAPSLALAAGADTGSSATDGVTRDAMPAVTGMAQAGSTVVVHIDGVAIGSVTAGADGAWSYRLTAPLADGLHSVTAVASNANGPGAASAALQITVDTAAPRLLAITARDTPVYGASTLRYELQFSESVILSAEALDIVASGSAQGRIESIVQTGEGRYLVQLAVSGEGTLALRVRQGAASDLACNVLANGASGSVYQLPSAPPPLLQDRLAAVSARPALEAAMVAAPDTVPVVLQTVAALAPDAWQAPPGGVRLLVPAPSWGQDAFAGSGMADAFPAMGGARLAARDVADLGIRSLRPGQSFELRLPPALMGAASVALQAADGRALPAWLHFEPQTGRISGKAPAGWDGELALQVVARDAAGQVSVTRLQLKTDAKAPARPEQEGAKDAAAPAKAALEEQLRELGEQAFEQQVAAWLAAEDMA